MIRIIVDSGSDYLPEEAHANGIEVLPLLAHVEGNEYRDGVDITRDRFYELLEETECFPKTSQISPHVFAEAFAEARNAGDEVICLTLSSELSGTYQSACLAQAMTGAEGIWIIDTLSAATPIHIMADYAAALRDEGLAAAEIVDEIESFKGRVRIIAALDTLDYLQRGGRIPKAAAKLGQAAKLKPLIQVTEEGTVGLLGAALGRKKALDGLIKHLDRFAIDTRFPVYPIYSYGQKNCSKLIERISETGLPLAEPLQIGFVVGAHIGPGACGLVFVEAESRR